MPPDPASPAASIRRSTFDRHFWLALLLGLLIVLPRALWITSHSSPAYDDQYHISRGLLVLSGAKAPLSFNDPPFGAVLTALPLHIIGVKPPYPGTLWGAGDIGQIHEHYNPYFTSTYHPYTLMTIVAAWKALLFLPTLAMAFAWARAAFNSTASGWLTLLLLALEPNLAGHIHTAALDVLGMQAVLLVAYTCWLYLRSPTQLRAAVMAASCALAMSIKHTAAIAPAYCVAITLVVYLFRRQQWGITARQLVHHLCLCILVGALALWAATLFDISQPRLWGRSLSVDYSSLFSFGQFYNDLMVRTLPAGTYFGSLAEALAHGADGHPAYLLGEIRSKGGWWYYHLVVMALKVPLPVFALLLLAALSFLWRRPTLADSCILAAMLLWAIFISTSGIDIGIRHAFPFYGLLLIFAARAATIPTKPLAYLPPILTALLAIDAARSGPWYISYFNLPYKNPHLLISDSNIDWGHTLRETRRWIDQNLPPDTPAKIIYWGDPFGPYVEQLVGPQYFIPRQQEMLPPTGYLIVSAAVQTLWFEQMGVLNDVPPVATIAGGAVRIYRMQDVWPIAARAGRFPPPPAVP
jgi:hypothetical protein